MKTILVLSDTHGNISEMEKLRGIMQDSDYILHLGDYQKDIAKFYGEFKDKIYSVKGNCDGGGNDAFLEIESLKIMLTHGDRYGVKSGLNTLYLRALEVGADVVFFGHNHKACIEEENGITLINPGTLSRYSQKSYCYAVIHDGKITAKTVWLIG